MQTVTANYARGIDLYHADSIKDNNAVTASGIRFCFLKATQGAGFTDTLFKVRWENLRRAGVLRGAYHYFEPGDGAVPQAKHFLNTVGPDAAKELPCVVDWEVRGKPPAASEYDDMAQVLSIVEKATGRPPMIYSGPAFLGDLMLPVHFANYPLWIAHYGAVHPMVPAPWKRWTFWQNSEHGVVPGIAGHCDTNFFNGTFEQLKTWSLKGNLTNGLH